MQLPHAFKSEDISIFSAVYNHEATIADTIESVLMQETRHSFQMYCLNDASTDDSRRILEDYRARHPDKITVFTSTENQGAGKKLFLHHKPPHGSRFWCLITGDDYWTCEGGGTGRIPSVSVRQARPLQKISAISHGGP